MCGIVGVLAFNQTGISQKDLEIFTDLFKVATVRGTDGAGVMYIGDKYTGLYRQDKTPYSSWVKIGASSPELMATQMYEAAVKDMARARFVIGHVRWATKGDVNTDNAHPFKEGSVTLVHNGTIETELKRGDKKFEVDSHVLCHDLNEKDMLSVIAGIKGGTAMVWYDNDDNKLRIYRNYERPLFHVKYGYKVFIASEPWMLVGCLERNSISVNSKPQLFATDTIFEWGHDDDEPLIITPVASKSTTSTTHSASNVTVTGGHWDTALNKWIEGIFPAANEPAAEVTNVVALPSPKPKVTLNEITRRHRQMKNTPPEQMKAVVNKFRNSHPNDNPAVKLIPTSDYFGILLGDRLIFEPTNMEYLEDKKRALISGDFKDITRMGPVSYGMLEDIRIMAKTHKKPKILPEKLYREPLLAGKVESIAINQDDISDVRIHLVDVEPFSNAAFTALQEYRIKHPQKPAH